MKAPALVMAATVVVFAGVTCVLTLRLREDVRAQILRREAESLRAMVDLQQERAEEAFVNYGLGANLDDWFPLLLETAKLRGQTALRLFDATGVLRDAQPAAVGAQIARGDWARLERGETTAQLHPPTQLAAGVEPGKPRLEVLVPLREPLLGEFGGVAQYWIDGTALVREFAALDRSLWLRSGAAVAVGLLVVLAALAWTFGRLSTANRELRVRTDDLARANQEFSLAAKTSALGAITAHLIHGLKNPLAGLEGYVTGQTGGTWAERGGEWETAMETTRRLRSLVNEVVTILHEEPAGGAVFPVKIGELLAHAEWKIRPLAAARGVTLICRHDGEVELPNRRANLFLLVLDNLLRNACEASPRDGTVTLRATRAPDGGVVFFVEDQGPGLPAQVSARLFQPVTSTKTGGGGIGLVISRHLAQHAGGQLELVKSDAQGCCFRLSALAVV